MTLDLAIIAYATNPCHETRVALRYEAQKAANEGLIPAKEMWNLVKSTDSLSDIKFDNLEMSDDYENEATSGPLRGWYGVSSDTSSIFAYFVNEELANDYIVFSEVHGKGND